MKENQTERCQKCFLVKTYKWHKKSFTRWFNQKRTWCSMLKMNFIIFSWLYISTYYMCWSTINDLKIVKYFPANLCWFQHKYKGISNMHDALNCFQDLGYWDFCAFEYCSFNISVTSEQHTYPWNLVIDLQRKMTLIKTFNSLWM